MVVFFCWPFLFPQLLAADAYGEAFYETGKITFHWHFLKFNLSNLLIRAKESLMLTLALTTFLHILVNTIC